MTRTEGREPTGLARESLAGRPLDDQDIEGIPLRN